MGVYVDSGEYLIVLNNVVDLAVICIAIRQLNISQVTYDAYMKTLFPISAILTLVPVGDISRSARLSRPLVQMIWTFLTNFDRVRRDKYPDLFKVTCTI